MQKKNTENMKSTFGKQTGGYLPELKQWLMIAAGIVQFGGDSKYSY